MRDDGGFALYVHWPYCARICPYCDFNVYRRRDRDPQRLLDAILADIAGHAERSPRRGLDSIFLGGGTPSLLDARQIEAILAASDSALGHAAEIEISLEANPEDVARFADHAAAGVNRFSIGVQALDDAALRALGRNHDRAAAKAAVDAAAATGRRVSIDLIYARPGQTADAWRRELVEALALPAEHLSLYQLTIEPGTAFERAAARGRLSPPDLETAAALYEVTQAVCDAVGAPAYEISNHARGPEARARHNLVYWRSGAWVGVGPGAHGRIAHEGERWATIAAERPEAYIDAVAQNGVGWRETERLSPQAAAEEALLMGLRLAEGVSASLVPPSAKRAELVAAGLLTVIGGLVALTAAGRLVANRVAAELIA